MQICTHLQRNSVGDVSEGSQCTVQMHLCPLLPVSLGLEEDTSFTKESTTFHESGRDKAPWESAVRRDGPSGGQTETGSGPSLIHSLLKDGKNRCLRGLP